MPHPVNSAQRPVLAHFGPNPKRLMYRPPHRRDSIVSHPTPSVGLFRKLLHLFISILRCLCCFCRIRQPSSTEIYGEFTFSAHTDSARQSFNIFFGKVCDRFINNPPQELRLAFEKLSKDICNKIADGTQVLLNFNEISSIQYKSKDLSLIDTTHLTTVKKYFDISQSISTEKSEITLSFRVF